METKKPLPNGDIDTLESSRSWLWLHSMALSKKLNFYGSYYLIYTAIMVTLSVVYGRVCVSTQTHVCRPEGKFWCCAMNTVDFSVGFVCFYPFKIWSPTVLELSKSPRLTQGAPEIHVSLPPW